MGNETFFQNKEDTRKSVTLGKSSTKVAPSSEVGGIPSQMFTSCPATLFYNAGQEIKAIC